MTARRKPYIVGLTGGIASGKTTAANYLQSLGAVIIDADAISHQLTAPGGEALQDIRKAFGDEVFLPDGALDRSKLGHLVFSNPEKKRELERILHPAIQRDMLRMVDEAGERQQDIVFLVVPLLYETGMDALCQETWVVTLEDDQQLMRLMARDGIGREQADLRIKSQMPQDERNARASVLIKTGRPVEQTRQELERLFMELKRRVERQNQVENGG